MKYNYVQALRFIEIFYSETSLIFPVLHVYGLFN